ncbi:MAG: zinc-binding dehydrogenase [Candidatus Thermoplasmatota archaeon]|nr:zinc-binding dehydrogenase [Candidatus Thermoplasmatota archaeon]
MPERRQGCALIRVEASSVNRLDIAVRNGIQGLSISMPHIPGADAVGTVVESSPGSAFRDGDRVVINPGVSCGRCVSCLTGRASLCPEFRILGEHMDGTYSEFISVPEINLKAVPASYPVVKAAAAPLVYITAWHSLVSRGRLGFGERVLITGGGGGVSTAAIQIAKLFDCHVAVTTRRPEKEKRLLQAGADEVITTSAEGWSKDYMRSNGKLFNVVLDSVGTALWKDSFRLLDRGGRFINYGRTSGGLITTDLSFIFWKQLQIIGSTMGDPSDFNTVMGLVFDRKLEPVVDSVFSLRDAARAQQHMEKGEHIGKIVLVVGE